VNGVPLGRIRENTLQLCGGEAERIEVKRNVQRILARQERAYAVDTLHDAFVLQIADRRLDAGVADTKPPPQIVVRRYPVASPVLAPSLLGQNVLPNTVSDVLFPHVARLVLRRAPARPAPARDLCLSRTATRHFRLKYLVI